MGPQLFVKGLNTLESGVIVQIWTEILISYFMGLNDRVVCAHVSGDCSIFSTQSNVIISTNKFVSWVLISTKILFGKSNLREFTILLC